jgi:hypothetical protein
VSTPREQACRVLSAPLRTTSSTLPTAPGRRTTRQHCLRIDPVTNTVTGTIAVPGGRPAWRSSQAQCGLARTRAATSRIDPATNVTQVPVATAHLRGSPRETNSRVASGGNNVVLRIDPATNAVADGEGRRSTGDGVVGNGLLWVRISAAIPSPWSTPHGHARVDAARRAEALRSQRRVRRRVVGKLRRPRRLASAPAQDRETFRQGQRPRAQGRGRPERHRRNAERVLRGPILGLRPGPI